MTSSGTSSSTSGIIDEIRGFVADEARETGRDRDQAILRVVERHVLPRLVCIAPLIGGELSQEETRIDRVAEITDLALDGNTRAARDMLVRLHMDGAGFSELQLRLLMPAAVRLHLLWREDEVSFLDVTLATLHLQQMMRFVSVQLTAFERRPYNSRTVLLAPAPGDTHVFAASMAAEFFRRDGWNVAYDPMPTQGSLVSHVEAGWYDAVAISAAKPRTAGRLRGTIAALRACSANRRILVIAGGAAVAACPDALDAIGADAALAALDVAPARAHRLLNMRASGRC